MLLFNTLQNIVLQLELSFTFTANTRKSFVVVFTALQNHFHLFCNPIHTMEPSLLLNHQDNTPCYVAVCSDLYHFLQLLVSSCGLWCPIYIYWCPIWLYYNTSTRHFLFLKIVNNALNLWSDLFQSTNYNLPHSEFTWLIEVAHL